MKAKILVSSAFLLFLAAGQAGAQTADVPDRDQTGNTVPMAPGNPNTSTIVTPEIPSTNSSPMTGPNTNTEMLNSIAPSGGAPGAAMPRNILATVPANLSYSQFTTYLDNQWGINGGGPITEAQWNSISPAYFGGDKPSFNSLDGNRGATLDGRDLRPVYSSLYRQYQQYNGGNNIK